MSEKDLSRREFLQRTALLGVAIGAAPVLASCATKEAGTGGGEGGALDCSDVTALTEQEVQTRTGLQYVEASTKADQNCLNCQHYVAPTAEGECGTCALVPGKINSAGWCLSWLAKAS